MTLPELVIQVNEKVHLGELEILEIVRQAWPNHREFTPTQAALVINSIQTAIASRSFKTRTLNEGEIWGK